MEYKAACSQSELPQNTCSTPENSMTMNNSLCFTNNFSKVRNNAISKNPCGEKVFDLFIYSY